MHCKKCGVQIEVGKEYCDSCINEENTKEQEVFVNKEDNNEKDPSNINGILALIFSIIGILGYLPFAGPILGIIFGKLSKNSEGEQLGNIGLIIGVVGLIFHAVSIILSLILLFLSLFMAFFPLFIGLFVVI